MITLFSNLIFWHFLKVRLFVLVNVFIFLFDSALLNFLEISNIVFLSHNNFTNSLEVIFFFFLRTSSIVYFYISEIYPPLLTTWTVVWSLEHRSVDVSSEVKSCFKIITILLKMLSNQLEIIQAISFLVGIQTSCHWQLLYTKHCSWIINPICSRGISSALVIPLT